MDNFVKNEDTQSEKAPPEPKLWEDWNKYLEENPNLFQLRESGLKKPEDNIQKGSEEIKRVEGSKEDAKRTKDIKSFLETGLLEKEIETWNKDHNLEWHTLEVSKVTPELKEKACHNCLNKFNDLEEYFINCGKCSKEKGFYGICRQCVWKDKQSNEITDITDDPLQKLPFSKCDLEKFQGKEERWVCGSNFMKGNNLPDDFCKCLLGLTPNLTQEEFERRQFNTVVYVKAKDRELRFCAPCYNFWKQYKFAEETDYTKFTIPSEQIGLNKDEKDKTSKKSGVKLFKKPKKEETSVKKDKCLAPYMKFQNLASNPTLTGHELYRMIKDQFARTTLPKILKKTAFTIHGFAIDKEKHLRNFPADIQQNFEQITSTQINTDDFSSCSLKKCEFNNNFRIIVGASEVVKIKDQSERFAKTLRIFNPDDDYKEEDCILLETLHESDTERTPSYLQFSQFIIYFKRIFTAASKADGDAKPSEEKPENNSQISEEKDKVDQEQQAPDKVAKECYSYLQLCIYNLETKEEKMFRNYTIPEVYGHYSVLFNTNFGSTFMIVSNQSSLQNKVHSTLEEAIKEIQEVQKEDSTVQAQVIDLNKLQAVYGNKIEEMGDNDESYDSYNNKKAFIENKQIPNFDCVKDMFESLDNSLNEPVTEEERNCKDFDYSDTLKSARLFNHSYFLLFKATDLNCIDAQKKSFTTSETEKTPEKYCLIYRMDKPQQPVKYFLRNDEQTPKMLFRSCEALRGRFLEMHSYPNIKMKDKAEFKSKPKGKETDQSKGEKDEEGKKDEQNKDQKVKYLEEPTQVQIAMQQQNQDPNAINYRNVLIIKCSESSFLTYHYEQEEITPNAYVKKRNEWQELQKKINESLNQKALEQIDPNKQANKVEENKLQAFLELSEEQQTEIDLKHQGFIKIMSQEKYEQNSAEIWSANIQNVKLPYQDETCSYTQFFFQNLGGEIQLLYPVFDLDLKLKAGEGDCTTTKTYLEYLREKAQRQNDSYTLKQALQANYDEIQSKLQQDLGIKVNPKAFEFYSTNFYQDLIWTSESERFSVHILQMNLQNEVIDGSFYKQPQIGVKIDDSFEKLKPQERLSQSVPYKYPYHFNSKYKSLIYSTDQWIFYQNDNDSMLWERKYRYENPELKAYLEGQNGKLIAVDVKDKKSEQDKAFSNLTVNMIFIAKTKISMWFMLEVLQKDDNYEYYMLVQKQHNDFTLSQNGILKSDSEVFVFKNNKNTSVDLVKFRNVQTFFEQSTEKLDEYKGNLFIREQYVDNKFEFTALVMVYANIKNGQKECLSVLAVDLEAYEKNHEKADFNIPTQLLKMQMKKTLNETINYTMYDIQIQRFSDRYQSQRKGWKTNYVFAFCEYNSSHEQNIYEIELNKFEDDGKHLMNFNVIRKTLLMYSKDLINKNECNIWWSQITPVFDKLQSKFEGYFVYNSSYYPDRFSYINYQDQGKRQHKYETEIMNLECRKLIRKDFKPSEYVVFLDAKFKKYIRDEFEFQFEIFDEKHLLDQALYSMFNMVQFDLIDYLTSPLNAYVDITKTNVFKKREDLFGYTISDIFVKDPSFINEALTQGATANRFDKTIAEHMYEGADKDELEYLKELGHFKGDSVYFLQCDFIQENLLMRAVNEKSFKTAILIIEHIFNLEEGRTIYQVEFMKALPVILSEEKIATKMVQFFELPDEDNKLNQLSFEQLITDEEAPLFATVQWDVIEAQAQDYNNFEQELVTKLLEKEKKRADEFKSQKELTDSKASEEEPTEIVYSVKNTFVDFRAMICSQKFQKFKETGTFEVNFDNYFLSNMVENMSSNLDFLSCESVKRMINHHFLQSSSVIYFQAGLFCFCYYIPFLSTLFFPKNVVWNAVIYSVICMTTLLFFFGIEFIQIRMNGIKDYVSGSGIWNFFDFTQFVIFLTLFVMNAKDGFDGLCESEEEEICQKYTTIVILECYLILTGFVKILFYMRLNESFGQLVMMVQSIFSSVGPFLIFFVLWVVFFAFMYFNLGIQVEDADSKYVGVNKFVIYVIMAYRCSIGDISVPGYSQWADKEGQNTNLTIVSLIWFIWIVNQFMNLIVLLNFLIAVVSAVHEQATTLQKPIMLQNKAILNQEYFQMLKYFKMCAPYGVLMFQIEVKDQENEEIDPNFLNLSQTIQNYIKKSNAVQSAQFLEATNNLAIKLESLKESQKAQQTGVAEMQKEMAELKSQNANILKELKKLDKTEDSKQMKPQTGFTEGKPWKDVSYVKVNLQEEVKE